MSRMIYTSPEGPLLKVTLFRSESYKNCSISNSPWWNKVAESLDVRFYAIGKLVVC